MVMEYYIVVTYDCNLACDYCFERANIKERGCIRRDNEKTKELPNFVEHLISHFKRTKQEEYSCQNPCSSHLEDRIVFYGGEPLLNQQLILKIMKAVKNEEKIKHFKFGLQTNGTLLKTMHICILCNLDDILVSIDGDKQAHDKHRKFPDGSGTYDIIMENLRWLKKQ